MKTVMTGALKKDDKFTIASSSPSVYVVDLVGPVTGTITATLYCRHTRNSPSSINLSETDWVTLLDSGEVAGHDAHSGRQQPKSN